MKTAAREKVAEQFARWWWVAAVALIALGAVAAVVFIRPVPIAGVAVANHDIVVAMAAEREATAAKQAAAEEAALLASIEDETLRSLQAYFNDPANDASGEGLAVLAVGLTRTGDNVFEGLATMTRFGGKPHDIPVHVTDDGRRAQWTFDAGALLPLFR
jgi:hypothetical protein